MGSSYHQLYYHLVWSTYRRQELINADMEQDLMRLIQDKIIEHKSELLGFGCTTDHVHLLVRLHPSVSVSGIVGEIKGYSSYTLANQIYPDSGFRWQGGFGALSVSYKDLPRLAQYIKNQKDHHCKNNIVRKWKKIS